MEPKPIHLSPEYADQFRDRAVVEAYARRPPYPKALIRVLRERLADSDGVLLDLGCGLGEISRQLAASFRSITAVDSSEAMLAEARRLSGGDSERIQWLCSPVEEASFVGPFAAVLAAESFHWFDWVSLVPSLIAVVPSRRLLLVEREEVDSPWKPSLLEAILRYSTNREFRPYALVGELEKRGLFIEEGRQVFGPVPFSQSIDDYVESIHSRNGFSRDRMEPADAAAFDERVVRLTRPFGRRGRIDLRIRVTLVWGTLENGCRGPESPSS
ncbi:MAG: class I SAM-dependent methyltransferase [bacterium]|nr:class I SAM-dependent methyltransferase [bacterium]MCP5065875.1 class I SAM-dependent methyltransferase [bacterium]